MTPMVARSCDHICAMALEPGMVASPIDSVVVKPSGWPACCSSALAFARSKVYRVAAGLLYQGLDGRYRDWVAGAG